MPSGPRGGVGAASLSRIVSVSARGVPAVNSALSVWSVNTTSPWSPAVEPSMVVIVLGIDSVVPETKVTSITEFAWSIDIAVSLLVAPVTLATVGVWIPM